MSAAPSPFRFYTSLILQEATGLRAATLPQLSQLLREVPDACIYHHTHNFLLSHQYLRPEPTHDFAYWVSVTLGEQALGEKLASVDPLEYDSLGALRDALIDVIDRHLESHPMASMKFVTEGEELFFVKAVHVILPTSHTARNLEEFASALERVSIHSLYYHLFDTRLRLGRKTNDFSLWVSRELGLTELADDFSRMDLYSQTLEGIREKMLTRIRSELRSMETARA